MLRRLEVAFWIMAIGLGFFHLWADPHYLRNTDAMSYLDLAEAYLRGDWHAAINAYWSPLYPSLIALALALVKPGPYWKFAVLHVVNFAIYLFALGCIGFLIREALRQQQSRRPDSSAAGLVTLPDWAILALGYSLFIWTTLFLVGLPLESPDLLVASLLYLATGILLRIRRIPLSWWSFVWLGVVLGFGYLAKTIMLPMALVFIVLGMLAAGSWRRAVPRVFLTLVVFLLIATPFIVAISRNKGRWTTGESGRLNYLWAINRVPYFHWQGEETGHGIPLHPTRKIFDTPPAFEFGDPVPGTYPVWYDPTYWYEGSVSHFDWRRQLGVFVEAAQRYYELFHNWGLQYGLLVGLLFLYLMGLNARQLYDDLTEQWPLLIPAFAGMGLYSLINVQGRYVAPFIVLLWLALFLAVRLQNAPNTQKLTRSISLVLVGAIIFTTLASSGRETTLAVRHLVTGQTPSAHEHWQVAEGLREMGLESRDKVAYIGNSFRAFWAHLGGLQIVADIHRDKVDAFWEADATVKSRLINAFARTGAKAIVAEKPPTGMDLSGWRKIRETGYYVYIF